MNNDLSKKKEENLYTYPELAKLLNVTVGRLRTAKSIINDSLKLNKHYFYSTIKAGSPQMIQWTKLGAILLANRIRTPESSIFLEKLGIKERHRSRIEHDAIGVIVHAIQGYAKFKKQFFVYQFKVDLYLPEQKIVIECDEKDHKGYDKSYEEFREQVIKDKLKCEFIRFNPIPPSRIGDVINIIFSRVFDLQQLKQ